MKVSLITAASLATLAAAQPHHAHHHLHVRETTVSLTYAPIQTAEVFVYVDENGSVLYTSYANRAAPTTSSPAAATSAPASSSLSAYTQTPSSTAAAATSSGVAISGGSYGLTYSPYKASGACKSQAEVTADFAPLTGYSMVRMYGTDCNQVSTILTAAKAKGMKVFAGIYDINALSSELSLLIAGAKGSWDTIDTVSVGNELVDTGKASAAQVVAAVNQARTTLRAAGYTGPVVTVDTFVAVIANPSLCEASDYAAANCHAFFDGGVDSSGAGTFVLNQSKRIAAACNGKKVVITETGWPSAGTANKNAIPSESNQQGAVNSIKAAFTDNPTGVILFNAYNDQWKVDNAGTFGCEKFWGMNGNSASS